MDGGVGSPRRGIVQAYRWLARYRDGGTAALIDRSSALQQRPHQVPDVRVAEIERRRRQRLSGPAIARQLAMPVSTVGARRSGPTSVVGPGSQARLRRLGLGKLNALEPKPPVVRYQREQPGELVHTDTKKLGRIEAVGHRITGAALRAAHRGRPWEPAARRDTRRGAGWEAVHVCIDDGSRLAYSEVLPDERKTSAVPFLERALGCGGRRGGPRGIAQGICRFFLCGKMLLILPSGFGGGRHGWFSGVFRRTRRSAQRQCAAP